MADQVRFELGFRGGGSVSGEAPVEEWAKIEQALTGAGGVVELTSGVERLWVRVDDLTYVRRHERDRRLGFSG